MGHFENTVTILYGPGSYTWAGTPLGRYEDMYQRLSDYQRTLRQDFDLELQIAMRMSPLTAGDTVPSVRVERKPVFAIDACNGGVDTLHMPMWEKDDLRLSPLVMDRDIPNFEFPDGQGGKEAQGIGLPPRQVINTKAVQNLGNRKDEMAGLLRAADVGLQTYGFTPEGIDGLEEVWGDVKTIVKPQGGAGSTDIRVFDDVASLKRGLTKSQPGDILEPFISRRHAVSGLKAYNADAAEDLAALNDSGVVREKRMHLGAYTDPQGSVHMWTYPVMRFNADNTDIMGDDVYAALDPESTPEDSYQYQKSMEIGRLIMEHTGAPQFYVALDWVDGITPHGERLEYVTEANCRSPQLWEGAVPARQAFMRMWATIARQNIDYPHLVGTA